MIKLHSNKSETETDKENGQVRDKRPEKTSPGDVPLDNSMIDILVVDDQSDIRRMLSQFLESSGARVRSAGDAGWTMQPLAKRQADIIVSDIRFPHRSSLELALSCGMNDILLTPIDPDMLSKYINERAHRVTPDQYVAQ